MKKQSGTNFDKKSGCITFDEKLKRGNNFHGLSKSNFASTHANSEDSLTMQHMIEIVFNKLLKTFSVQNLYM